VASELAFGGWSRSAVEAASARSEGAALLARRERGVSLGRLSLSKSQDHNPIGAFPCMTVRDSATCPSRGFSPRGAATSNLLHNCARSFGVVLRTRRGTGFRSVIAPARIQKSEVRRSNCGRDPSDLALRTSDFAPRAPRIRICYRHLRSRGCGREGRAASTYSGKHWGNNVLLSSHDRYSQTKAMPCFNVELRSGARTYSGGWVGRPCPLDLGDRFFSNCFPTSKGLVHLLHRPDGQNLMDPTAVAGHRSGRP